MAIKRKGKAGQWGVGVQVLSADLNDTIYDISHQWGVSVLTDINVREFIAYATNIQLGGGITQHSKTYLGLNDISGNRSQTVTIPTNGNRVVLLFIYLCKRYSSWSISDCGHKLLKYKLK